MDNQNPNELNKNLLVVCGTIIVICIVAAATVLLGGFNKSGNSVADNTQTQGQPTAQTVDVSKVKIAGQPFVGSANAPVVIAFWSDYQCPFCKKVESEVMGQVYNDYVATGKAKIVYKDYEFLGTDSQTLGQFARAVWAVAPDKFWQWHKAMFENQGTENTGWATHAKIMSITTAAIGAGDAAKADALATSHAADYQKAMDADKTEGTSFGIQGTPATIIGKQFINGAQPYSAFKAAIDQVLAGK